MLQNSEWTPQNQPKKERDVCRVRIDWRILNLRKILSSVGPKFRKWIKLLFTVTTLYWFLARSILIRILRCHNILPSAYGMQELTIPPDLKLASHHTTCYTSLILEVSALLPKWDKPFWMRVMQMAVQLLSNPALMLHTSSWGYNCVQSTENQLTFRSNMSPPSPGSKRSMKQAPIAWLALSS
jgi:hypothetical protein